MNEYPNSKDSHFPENYLLECWDHARACGIGILRFNAILRAMKECDKDDILETFRYMNKRKKEFESLLRTKEDG